MPTFRGPISLGTRLLAGTNVTLTGGTSDGAGGVYLTSDVTITATGGGGGSYSAGTGLTLTGSVFAVAFGTSSSTVCVGNDSRVTGAVQSSTLTTRGDLFVRNASAVTRLALGSSGQVLYSDGTDAGWHTLTAGDVGAIAASTLTTQGDILVRGASAPSRLGIGAGNTVLVSTGTDPAWSTVAGVLAAMGSTRGMTLRYGAAAWEALSLGTSGQVLHSDGTDVAWYTLTASDVGADASGAAAAAQAAAIAASAQRASNLSDLASALSARTNLGLGGAAVLSVGTTAGTVAAGDDSRITGAAQKSANLSDLASAATARTNLGLGGAAVLSVGTTAGTVAAGDDSRIVNAVPNTRTVNGHALSTNVTVTASDVSALALAGGTMAGNIAMGANAITGLANPTSAQDADTKAARDTAIAAVTTTTLGAVPTSRTLTTTAPLRIDAGASADLSANRTLSITTATTSAVGVVQLSSATPQPLGTAAAGSAGTASDAGHVHAMPTAADVGALATTGGTLSGDLTLTTTHRLLAGTNVLVGAVTDKLNAAMLAIASQAVGDVLYADTTTTFARLAAGATDTVQRIVGGVPTWSTLTSLLDTLGSTRGQLLRRGASTWSALAASTADTFVGGDGTDVGVRTATQVKTTLGLPTSFTTAYALLQVNAGRTGWQEYVQTIVDEPWNRPDPSTTTAGTTFLNKRDNTAQVCSGLAAVANVPGTGWIQQLPTRLGDDRAGIKVNSAQVYMNTDLSAYTVGNLTAVVLFYYDGTLSGSAYGIIAVVGDFSGSTRGICSLALHANAGNIDLVCTTGAGATQATLKASWNPSTGIHRVVVAPISGNKWRFTYDGVAVGADVAMGTTYTTPNTTDQVGFCGRSSGASPLLGQGLDMLVFNSQLSSADMAAITTAPSPETYQLAESSSTGAAAIRVQACRFDPSFPTVLPCRGGLGVMTVAGSPVKVNY
jgi:hypothetical protein